MKEDIFVPLSLVQRADSGLNVQRGGSVAEGQTFWRPTYSGILTCPRPPPTPGRPFCRRRLSRQCLGTRPRNTNTELIIGSPRQRSF